MEARANRISKRVLVIGISLVAVAAVVYFSIFWPPQSSDDMQGTIGAAKKYRSEQITDKDVKLEGVQTGTSSDAVVADDVTIQSLNRAAVDLGNTALSFDVKSPYGSKAAENFQRTAQAMKDLGAYALANREKLERTPLADLSQRAENMNAAAAAILSSKEPLNERALADFEATAQFISVQASALEKNPNLLEQRSAYNRAADVDDLKSAAAILSSTAKDLGARGLGAKGLASKELAARQGLNVQASSDLQMTADALLNSAAALERQPSYDRQAVSDLASQAANLSAAAALGLKEKFDAKAVSDLGQKAQELQSSATYFQKNATLDRAASLNRGAALERNANYGRTPDLQREANLDRNAPVGSKAPSGQ